MENNNNVILKIQESVPHKFLFMKEFEEVGQLSWEDGLEFKGNIDESAKVFFEFLKPYIDDYMKYRKL